jgi:uncharacterized protein (TIGR03435 family)
MRVLTLALLCACVSTAPAQQPAASSLTFEVATIKPSAPGQSGRGLGWNHRHFTSHFTTLSQMMQFAWNVQQKQIINEPAWFDTETFDIDAQSETGEPTVQEWHTMMQHLLTERLGLTLHHEDRTLPAYVLEVAKSGTKLTESAAPDPSIKDFLPGVRIMRGQHMYMRVVALHGTMPELAAELQRVETDRPVVDKTALTGRYNFTLTATSIKPFFANDAPDPDNPQPELFTAIREQLGLQLVPAKTSVDCLILDHISKPTLD